MWAEHNGVICNVMLVPSYCSHHLICWFATSLYTGWFSVLQKHHRKKFCLVHLYCNEHMFLSAHLNSYHSSLAIFHIGLHFAVDLKSNNEASWSVTSKA